MKFSWNLVLQWFHWNGIIFAETFEKLKWKNDIKMSAIIDFHINIVAILNENHGKKNEIAWCINIIFITQNSWGGGSNQQNILTWIVEN